jgi:predicted Rossmann-fold nucleotide-binding protein
MGVVSSTIVKNSGRVHGILPLAMIAVERASNNTSMPAELRDPARSDEKPLERSIITYVSSMHDRKRFMARAAQKGFLVLPGGYGTLEEAAEMVTWNQLSIHSKRRFRSI